MSAPDFEVDTYPVTQSGPISAPLTLAEVREYRESAQEWMAAGCRQGCEHCHHKAFPCSDRKVEILVATIEWLAERIGASKCDLCGVEPCTPAEYDRCEELECELINWLRGQA